MLFVYTDIQYIIAVILPLSYEICHIIFTGKYTYKLYKTYIICNHNNI